MADEPLPPVSDFTRGYLTCALWASIGEDDLALNERYDVDDLSVAAQETMIADCVAFERDNAALLAAANAIDLTATDARHGHDFWLTRNRHGAGFWDRGYGSVGEELTEAAHAFGDAALLVGDFGEIEVI